MLVSLAYLPPWLIGLLAALVETGLVALLRHLLTASGAA